MVMLDKEVAEERAEMAEAELEEVKEKLAVLEVEMGVIKDGGEWVFRWSSCLSLTSAIRCYRGWWLLGKGFIGLYSTRET